MFPEKWLPSVGESLRAVGAAVLRAAVGKWKMCHPCTSRSVVYLCKFSAYALIPPDEHQKSIFILVIKVFIIGLRKFLLKHDDLLCMLQHKLESTVALCVCAIQVPQSLFHIRLGRHEATAGTHMETLKAKQQTELPSAAREKVLQPKTHFTLLQPAESGKNSSHFCLFGAFWLGAVCEDVEGGPKSSTLPSSCHPAQAGNGGSISSATLSLSSLGPVGMIGEGS